jgi:hypothetical protein
MRYSLSIIELPFASNDRGHFQGWCSHQATQDDWQFLGEFEESQLGTRPLRQSSK